MAKLKFLLFSQESASRIHPGFLWVGILLEKIFPGTKNDLETA